MSLTVTQHEAAWLMSFRDIESKFSYCGQTRPARAMSNKKYLRELFKKQSSMEGHFKVNTACFSPVYILIASHLSIKLHISIPNNNAIKNSKLPLIFCFATCLSEYSGADVVNTHTHTHRLYNYICMRCPRIQECKMGQRH